MVPLHRLKMVLPTSGQPRPRKWSVGWILVSTFCLSKTLIHDAAYTSKRSIKHFMWINSLNHENESSLLWDLLLETSWSSSPDQEEVERAGKGHFPTSWECPNPAENLACRRPKVSSISSEHVGFICMRHSPRPLEVTPRSGPAFTTLRRKKACLWQTGKAKPKRCDNNHLNSQKEDGEMLFTRYSGLCPMEPSFPLDTLMDSDLMRWSSEECKSVRSLSHPWTPEFPRVILCHQVAW